MDPNKSVIKRLWCIWLPFYFVTISGQGKENTKIKKKKKKNCHKDQKGQEKNNKLAEIYSQSIHRNYNHDEVGQYTCNANFHLSHSSRKEKK